LPECKPVATKSRRYSRGDSEFIQPEVKRLLAADIIEPARSPWRAQVLVIHQGTKRRLVIDYSTTINRFTLLDAYPVPNIEELANTVAQDKFYSLLDLRSAYHQAPLLPEERQYTAFETSGRLFQYKRLAFGVTNGVAAFQRCIDNFIKRYNLKNVYAYLDDITVTGATLAEHDINLKLLLDAANECNLTLNETKSNFHATTLDMLRHRISHNQVRPDAQRLRPLLDLPPPSTAKELKRVSGMFSYYSKWIPRFSEKAGPLLHASTYPLHNEALNSFRRLKDDLAKACLGAMVDDLPFEAETDASDFVLAAILSQGCRPAAFMSRTLTSCERRYPAVEKEACAIIEAVRRWKHYLNGRHFSLVTDQQDISYMFDQNHKGKIKNTKILSWRLELTQFSYDIRHRPGVEHVAPDAFSRFCIATSNSNHSWNLQDLHESLGHPGYARLYHFVRQRNLLFSSEETKNIRRNCKTCAEIKPQFFRPASRTLIKAIRPRDRVSVDFKGPIRGPRPYLLIVVDEYSRFPFVFPCKNMTSSIVTDSFFALLCSRFTRLYSQ